MWRQEEERCRGPCLVANRATIPQKRPPPPWNVADSYELTETTKVNEAFCLKQVAIFPLMKNKPEIMDKATEIFNKLQMSSPNP